MIVDSTKPKLFSIPDAAIRTHYREAYEATSWLQSKFNSDFILFDLKQYYDILCRQFLELLRAQNIIADDIALENLHTYLREEQKSYGNKGISEISRSAYQHNTAIKSTLKKMIHEILYKKVICEPFLFQKEPTFRVHCPNAKNAGFFPHYHTDLALGHPSYHMNIWIPLTAKRSGHGFYLASLENSKTIAAYLNFDLASVMKEEVFKHESYKNFNNPKLSPVDVEAGQGLLFDSRCFHTAMPMQSHTRI